MMHYSAEGKQGRTIVARLKPGQDIVAGITSVIEKHNIKSGYIPVLLTGLKQLRIISMNFTDNEDNPQNVELEYQEPLDCFGQGTIATLDDKPSIHIHFTAAQAGNKTISGHLVSGIVLYVTELVIVEITGITMTRKKDPEVFNMPLLSFAFPVC